MIDNTMLSELEIVAHRGAENASEAISVFISSKVNIKINGVDLMPIDQVSASMGGEDEMAAALVCRIEGEISGNAALFFHNDDAKKLVSILSGDSSPESILDFGEMERSMLEETANITISSFMNSLTMHLGKKSVPCAPIFLLDYTGSIMSMILTESAEYSDKAIVFSSQFFCEGKQMNMSLLFLPSPVAIGAVEHGLD